MDVVTSEEEVKTTKRQATRKALLDATKTLVFEKGHDRISIQDITQRARVATGTYYNYFDTKQDVFLAVARDMQDQLDAELEPTRAAIKDPAMKVALTLKYYLYHSINNQDWREFTRFTGLTDMTLGQSAEARIEDIQGGVKAGRFKVDDVHFTESLIAGMVRHVNTAIDKGHIGRNAMDYATRSILQMLGLPEIVAKALTQTALPPMAAQKRQRSLSAPATTVTSLSEYQEEIQVNYPRVDPLSR